MKKPRFPIGLEFEYYRVKHNKARVITDIMTTTNSKGDIVKIEYEVTHQFLGQSVKEMMVDTSIARSLSNDQLSKFN